ncbi:MAG TPA: cytochrome c biogenesis protein ResB [Bacteroidales bacterium]|nr:cytochrome c biogenesis protein ResB [Bacteroidales bacterium]
MSRENSEKNVKSRLWQFPWGYPESFLIAGIMIISGFIMQFAIGSGASMPAWPLNLVIIVVFIIYYILIHYFIKHPVLKWLSSTRAAIASVSAFTLMVMFLGFIPQGVDEGNLRFIDRIGLTSVTNSWAYLMCALYLLIVLGFTVMRRLNSFTLKNTAFILNHAGLWLVVVAASLGSADMWRLTMELQASHPVTRAYDSRGNAFELGFGMTLMDFQIEEYPPELVLVNTVDYTLEIEKGGKLAIVKEGEKSQLENYAITIERYLPFSRRFEGRKFDTTSMVGAARAAYVIAKDDNTGDIFEGWVSDGSFIYGATSLAVNDGMAIAMTKLRPKKYSSDIRLYHDMDNYEDFHIEVNKPAKMDGWKVYQTGYDEQMGRWSDRSIIELVKDPWLPVVYVGIFMILLGTLYLLWMGKGRTKNERS